MSSSVPKTGMHRGLLIFDGVDLNAAPSAEFFIDDRSHFGQGAPRLIGSMHVKGTFNDGTVILEAFIAGTWIDTGNIAEAVEDFLTLGGGNVSPCATKFRFNQTGAAGAMAITIGIQSEFLLRLVEAVT